jgi:hypothetical protein
MNIDAMTDDELWVYAQRLAMNERGATCDFIEVLSAIDERGVHKRHNYISLFECCINKFRLSEAAAYRRIRAARAIKLVPGIAELLRNGRLTLESVALLHPYLKDPDAASLVEKASGLRTWEVERLIASRRTEEPRRDVVRFVAPALASPLEIEGRNESTLFEPRIAAPPPETASEMAVVSGIISAPAGLPIRTSRHAVRIGFTADEAFFNLLKEAQAAMRHKYPDGRLDGVFRDALEALLRKKRPWAIRS